MVDTSNTLVKVVQLLSWTNIAGYHVGDVLLSHPAGSSACVHIFRRMHCRGGGSWRVTTGSASAGKAQFLGR